MPAATTVVNKQKPQKYAITIINGSFNAVQWE
jgi:hypothetical protein